MASGDANVRVRLDTRQAKKELEGLGKKGEAAAGRITDKVQGVGGGLGGTLAFGAAIGAGLGVVQRRASNLAGRAGATDVVSDLLGVANVKARADAALLGPEARGHRSAVDEAKQTFALQAHLTGDTSNAKAFVERVAPHRIAIEKGAAAIEADIAGKGVRDAAKDTAIEVAAQVAAQAAKVVNAVEEGFNKILSLIERWNNR